jgi:hypothetical protein
VLCRCCIFSSLTLPRATFISVGNSLDQACKLEAMLRSISIKRKKLRLEQKKVDNYFLRLLNDLQVSLQKDEDMTVICADTFSAVDHTVPSQATAPPASTSASLPPPATEIVSGSRQHSMSSTKEHQSESYASIARRDDVDDGNDSETDMLKPFKMERQITPPLPPQSTGSRLVCFANDVFDPASPQEAGRMLLASMSHPFLQSMGSTDNNDNNSVISTSTVANNIFSTVSQPSPNEMREGARAWRERNNRAPINGIDFRTGMSGHMALLSSHAHPHEYLEQKAATIAIESSRSRQLKMSSHMGLSRPKTNYFGIFGARPLGQSRSREEEAVVPRTGSM